MKKILVTGKGSYIGDRFTKYLAKWPTVYQVTQVSLKDNNWQSIDWTSYDAVLNVAGIAHNSSDLNLKELYYRVNRDLAIEAAKKAKRDGVEQFIHLSSMIVFGSGNEVITIRTKPNPDNFYGDSKLQGERGVSRLDDEGFRVAIVRPPMVYGPNSKGNFPKLAKLAKITPIFPDYPNKRSMIFIDNLISELKEIIDHNLSGYFHPQNNEYVKTSDMVKEIARLNGHKILITKLFNPIIRYLLKTSTINKIFGNLYYDRDMPQAYTQMIDFKETLKRTEGV